MAAGIMPAMQEPQVCEGECEHRDCASWKAQAALPCALCGKLIEAGDDYFVREVKDGRVTVQVHGRCAEQEAESEGAAHRWATEQQR